MWSFESVPIYLNVSAILLSRLAGDRLILWKVRSIPLSWTGHLLDYHATAGSSEDTRPIR